MNARITIKQELTLKPKLKLITRIRLASFIELGEKNFYEYVAEVESDPVFKKLLSAENADLRVVSYKRFPSTAFETSNLPIKEQISGDRAPVDVETLLSEKSGIAELIKKIGLEKFQKYFLQGEIPYAGAEICRECGISGKQLDSLSEFVNDLAIRSEFYHPSGIELESRVNYAKIAEIEYDGKSDFIINFFSPKYVSGRYVVNGARLSALKKQNAFSQEEVSRINKLLEKIELINSRKTTIYQIIKKIIEVQKNYLYSGEEKFLLPYTQKKLSEDAGIDDSMVSRAIYGRSVVTPHKIEKPLKFFFTNNKAVRRTLIKTIIESEPRKLTDKRIAQVLKEKFNITVPRRTVNACRNELLK